MPPRRATSPAPKQRIPTTDRVMRSASKKTTTAADPDVVASAATAAVSSNDSEFRRSVLIYLACISTLAAGLATVLSYAPPAPGGGVCDGVSLSLLPDLIPAPAVVRNLGIPLGTSESSTAAIIKMWRCATAYQKANWWFVLFFFELTYLSLKSFAIPATFAMCILGGAIFPLGLTQLLTCTGETVGSTMCYLLSSAIAKPILERLAPDKLLMMRTKSAEERDNMFLFNMFLRLSPFPNWLVNCSSPIVGNPLPHFIAGTFFGTQLSVCFLAQGGSVLRTVGEKGFDVATVLGKGLPLAATMFFLQFVPLAIIRRKKQQSEAAKAAATPAKRVKATKAK